MYMNHNFPIVESFLDISFTAPDCMFTYGMLKYSVFAAHDCKIFRHLTNTIYIEIVYITLCYGSTGHQ